MRPLLIIDFEATCWGPDQLPPPRKAGSVYASEIIEFGCALLDARGHGIGRTLQQYVMPVQHGRLTAFCVELTGITQPTVDSAPIFPMALAAFRDAFGIHGGAQPRLASWGNYDRNILLDDCAKHHVAYPVRLDNHVSLKSEAVHALGLLRRTGGTLEAIDRHSRGGHIPGWMMRAILHTLPSR